MSNWIRGAERRNKGKHRKYKGFETKDGWKLQQSRKEPGELLRSIGSKLLYDLVVNERKRNGWDIPRKWQDEGKKPGKWKCNDDPANDKPNFIYLCYLLKFYLLFI